ncbi:indole-3-glycerol phosphate synthase TrpC [Actinokineospora sp. PR83]|uniref:indole-3-glycerol phosphate synthase TrpC n=1 Tax=Actinokineospora sp. PR83 TaxID=2884908 RepID=UPI0027E057B7|nr:indole-3-glycerol phosphate synthase TrpC [Actinokineospora sp. PR83]MCG8917244.1 indole-3-glycerol phosphate synthase TrpC [Actinokineospora sp. PR83]
MNGQTTELLDRLVRQARAQTQRRRASVPEAELVRRAADGPPPRDFVAALRAPGLSVIAEVKRRSPVKGSLTADFRPVDRALAYQRGGAAALSVLTHEEGFGGAPEHLARIREHCALPLLRKDFVVDDYQVHEARAIGADAVLLVVSALSRARLGELIGLVGSLGMTALVEVHDAEEAEAAVAAGATAIGVNHRDLRTFTIDMDLTARLAPLITPERVLVAESGVRTAGEASALRAAGADAVLIGEALMRADDPAALVAALGGVDR